MIPTTKGHELIEAQTKWPPFRRRCFKCIFLNENVWISLKISLKFVPKGLINNIPSLVQIMAWRRPGDKPLSEPMMIISPTHICVTRPQWVNTGFWSFHCCWLRQNVEKPSGTVELPVIGDAMTFIWRHYNVPFNAVQRCVTRRVETIMLLQLRNFFLSLCIKFVSFMTIAYILTVISLNAIIAPSTSNMGNIFALLALCAGAPLVTGGFPLTEDHKCGPLMIYLHEHAFQQTVELIDMGRLKCVMIMK